MIDWSGLPNHKWVSVEEVKKMWPTSSEEPIQATPEVRQPGLPCESHNPTKPDPETCMKAVRSLCG